MHIRNFLTLCTACLLAACAGAQNTPAPTDTAPLSTVKAPSPQISYPNSQPEPRPTVRDSVRSVPAPPPAPDILIGLTSDAVDKLLGKPELVRRDGPAEVRLYRDIDTACTFHVFLYAKGAVGQPGAVEYFEARNIQGRLEGAKIIDCYNELVRPAATS